MRRWLNVLLIFAVMAAIVAGVVYRLQRPSRLQARFDQVRVGMTADEAVALVGEDREFIFERPPVVLRCYQRQKRRWWEVERRPRFFIVLDAKERVKETWVDAD